MQVRLLILSCILTSLAGAQSLVIQRVNVIDATGKPAQPDLTVVIEHGRIASISPWKKARVPKGAEIVDGRGKFLIPGLWDMHVHGAVTAWSEPLYLANGVLGVREMWGPPNANEWRAQRASADRPAPSIFLGSPILDGPKPTRPTFIAVGTEAQGRKVVDQQKEYGADFIKVYSLLPRDVYFAIADEARKRGIPFEGHVPYSVTAAEASDAGQKSMEHLIGVDVGCSREKKTIFTELQEPGTTQFVKLVRLPARAHETYDEPTARSLFARFLKNGTWQCPTLTVLRSASHFDAPKLLNDDRLKYMPKTLRASWQNGLGFKDLTVEDRTAMATFYAGSQKLVGRLYGAGVNILAGTDVLNPYCFPGFSLHDELALLVEAGLSPMAALQTATSNPAKFMGQFDRRGTIEAGKIADLVLLDKDPLADIHNTGAIQAIVLNGKLVKRAALDAMLTEAEAAAAK
jgi:imidazolonepropionase-like amidohydrolase